MVLRASEAPITGRNRSAQFGRSSLTWHSATLQASLLA
jgi:hypothetical protein